MQSTEETPLKKPEKSSTSTVEMQHTIVRMKVKKCPQGNQEI